MTRRDRMGTVLLAVLVVITISALAGTTAMYYGEAASAGARVSLKRTRSRALAWSGVQAVMAELADQRDKLLDGENPLITTQWQLFEESGKRGIVRLAVMEKDGAGQEQWAVSEAAKLDVNSATAEQFAKLPSLTPELGAAIVAARAEGFGSVEELVRVEGIKPEMLYGAGEEPDAKAPRAAPADASAALTSILGVFAFDPNVQAGLDPGGSDHRGKVRVNLNTPWSDELGGAIQDRFGKDAVAPAKKLFEEGQKSKSLSELCGVLQRLKVPNTGWAVFLDAFACNLDPFIGGRVDVNRAPASVLAAIPGITQDAADEIVRRRTGIDAAIKRSPTWVLTQGVLKEAEFVQAVDHLTTRSMQWRVRIEAGLIDPDASESASREPALEDRMVLEAVIDVASERPRVAYLRDVTMMDASRVMDRALAEQTERRFQPALAEPVAAASQPSPPPPPQDLLNIDGKLKMSGALQFDHDEPEPPPTPVMEDPVAPDVGPPAAAAAPESVDRRIGRWTSRAPEPAPQPKGGTP